MIRALMIETVPCLTDNLSYLVVLPEDQGPAVQPTPFLSAIAIDPGEAAPFFHALERLQARLAKPVHIEAVIATHHHQDHIGGLLELPEVPTWTSRRDQSRIPAAGGHGHVKSLAEGVPYTWEILTGSGSGHSCEITVLEIPGHTEGQIAIRFSEPDTSHLFVGDTLFSFGCGRCFEGTPEQLFSSLQKIKALTGETRLYFGHEYTLRNIDFWLEMIKRYPTDTSDLVDPQATTDLSAQLAKLLEEQNNKPTGFRPAPLLSTEVALNPFLKMKNATEFRRWRLERNSF